MSCGFTGLWRMPPEWVHCGLLSLRLMLLPIVDTMPSALLKHFYMLPPCYVTMVYTSIHNKCIISILESAIIKAIAVSLIVSGNSHAIHGFCILAVFFLLDSQVSAREGVLTLLGYTWTCYPFGVPFPTHNC